MSLCSHFHGEAAGHIVCKENEAFTCRCLSIVTQEVVQWYSGYSDTLDTLILWMSRLLKPTWTSITDSQSPNTTVSKRHFNRNYSVRLESGQVRRRKALLSEKFKKLNTKGHRCRHGRTARLGPPPTNSHQDGMSHSLFSDKNSPLYKIINVMWLRGTTECSARP